MKDHFSDKEDFMENRPIPTEPVGAPLVGALVPLAPISLLDIPPAARLSRMRQFHHVCRKNGRYFDVVWMKKALTL
jgi:hypothetical protein